MDGMTRRVFLGALGSGVVASAIGPVLADELAPGAAPAEGGPIDFAGHERLVARMQETTPEALMPLLAAEVRGGTSLETLVAAGALANARTFGGQDYVGYHCFMALLPALEMARRLPTATAALPVLKVLHRNATRIQQKGGRAKEVLRHVAVPAGPGRNAISRLHATSRAGDAVEAERLLGALAGKDARKAQEALQPLVRDNLDVHQVVLAWRGHDMLRIAGAENAFVMMRQTLRQCIQRERWARGKGRGPGSLVAALPALLESHGLVGRVDGTKRLDDAAFARLVDGLLRGTREEGATRVARALGAGVRRADIGEALVATGARLLLHDKGLARAQPGKPVGSVHGASVGVHASDAADAWHGIAQVASDTEANATLLAGAWHTAGQGRRTDLSRVFHQDARAAAAQIDASRLVGALGEALRGGDQTRATALVERARSVGVAAKEVVGAILPFALSQDGALHHEKYFATATTWFARTRPAMRWEHLAALARVAASGHGHPSAGYDQAKAALSG